MTESPVFWFGLFAVVAVMALVVVWPKYKVRRAGLDLKYAAQSESYQYRLQQSERAVAETQASGVARPSFAIWPIVLAAGGLMIPILAVIASALLQTRGRPREGESQVGESPAGRDLKDSNPSLDRSGPARPAGPTEELSR